MEFRHLGRTGFKVSEVVYGNWITHGSQVAEEQALQCVAEALELGITSFDTADVYAQGRAETVLGKALAGQRRDGLEIFTKVFWPTGSGANDRGLSRKHIVRSCEESLRRLQTDYLDLYQAHRFDVATPLDETLHAFDDLIRAGKVLYVGVSEWTAAQISEAVHLQEERGFDRFVSNQPQYSMLWRVIEAEVVPTCEELGLSQIVWSPLAQGVLTGKYQPGRPPPAQSRGADTEHGRFMSRFMTDEVLSAVQALRPLADEAGLTTAQLAIAWVLANSNVAAAIVGATRPEQLRETTAAVGVSLEPTLLDAVDQVLGNLVATDPGLTQSPAARP